MNCGGWCRPRKTLRCWQRPAQFVPEKAFTSPWGRSSSSAIPLIIRPDSDGPDSRHPPRPVCEHRPDRPGRNGGGVSRDGQQAFDAMLPSRSYCNRQPSGVLEAVGRDLRQRRRGEVVTNRAVRLHHTKLAWVRRASLRGGFLRIRPGTVPRSAPVVVTHVARLQDVLPDPLSHQPGRRTCRKTPRDNPAARVLDKAGSTKLHPRPPTRGSCSSG